MRRREFIALLGGAATWPFAAHAQQQSLPVIGFLSSRSPGESAPLVQAFRQGLGEAGFVEGRNLGGTTHCSHLRAPRGPMKWCLPTRGIISDRRPKRTRPRSHFVPRIAVRV